MKKDTKLLYILIYGKTFDSDPGLETLGIQIINLRFYLTVISPQYDIFEIQNFCFNSTTSILFVFLWGSHHLGITLHSKDVLITSFLIIKNKIVI